MGELLSRIDLGGVADVLSVVGFLVALWAGARVRSLSRAFQDLIRGEDLLTRLRNIASEISDGASDTDANRDAILLLFVNADATLDALKGRVGGRWFVVWGNHYEMEVVRKDLERYQERDRTLDRTAVMGEYRKIQRVAEKAENLMQARRLER